MIVEAVQSWLRQRWPDYEPIEHREGTYGVVFVVEARETNFFPQKFCVKTLNPAKLRPGGHDLKALFEREMRLWLKIPYHYHVLPALGLETALPPKELTDKLQVLPLVRMPYCEASLSALLSGAIKMPLVDRLIILAQICSGLQWVYQQGIQAHGDLKPDNILLPDLRRVFTLPEEEKFPSSLHPWQARVADFGWANIWLAGGGTYHAWRPYLAPERFRNTVEPEASDIFALGVIACELLSGSHPGGDRTESLAKKWKPKKWREWAESDQRTVSADPPALRDLLIRCLAANPADRPCANDTKITLCEILERTYGLQLAPQLRVQDEEARKLPSHGPWAAEEISRVSPDQLEKSISELDEILHELAEPRTPAQIAKWLETSAALQRLLMQRKDLQDLERLGILAAAELHMILERFGALDVRKQIYGELFPSDLAPEEVLWYYATAALERLKHAPGVTEARLKSYEERLQTVCAQYWPRFANSLRIIKKGHTE